MSLIPAFAARPLRRTLVGSVRAVLNDSTRGQTPVVRSDNALFPAGSVIWRVHGDVTSMMVGGVSALLLQMLHPAALAGIWDHSTFRSDMLGRLRRTARFIAVTTYADRSQALAALERVRQVHDRVTGRLPDGTPYRANDPHLLAWVHVTEALSFLNAWIRYAEPGMPRAEQDLYFAQFAEVARRLGAAPVPESRAEAEALMARMRPELRANGRTREVARLILRQKAPSTAALPIQKMTMEAAVDLLPDWARTLHALPTRHLRMPAIRLSTAMVAGTLRWAFADDRRPE